MFVDARDVLAALIDELPVHYADGHAVVRLTHLTDLLERIPHATGDLLRDRESWA
ncbi:hypothetical protein [Spirillospora sp. CA-294931]|uniref:hypothetical protein n=1 Tax=Spirillospora sp. CA-294931 TaxID=3240042 RepID=UPI003D915884